MKTGEATAYNWYQGAYAAQQARTSFADGDYFGGTMHTVGATLSIGHFAVRLKQVLSDMVRSSNRALRSGYLFSDLTGGLASGRIAEGIGAPNRLQYDPSLVPGPNPNGLRQRAATSPTAGEGGVYLKPQEGRTKIGSTDDFRARYGPNAKPGIEVEIPQTRNGPPAGVDDSAYPWSARAQRRFDEEYIDRITPRDVRFRAPNARSPVDPDKWERFRHIFGYGDLPSDFGY